MTETAADQTKKNKKDRKTDKSDKENKKAGYRQTKQEDPS